MQIDFSTFQQLYFLGIGGIGMSALARFFVAEKQVAGYDLTQTELTLTLEKSGISISYLDEVDQIPNNFLDPQTTLIVYTPAIPADNKILQFFKKNNFSIYKRAQVLQALTFEKRTLAVAGTHGKTTVSILLAHILNQRPEGCNAFLGGIAKNYQSNLLIGKTQDLVIEADEFDRTFLQFFPYLSVITAMDPDHLDVYQTAEKMEEAYQQYASQVSDILIYKSGLFFPKKTGRTDYTYSFSDKKSDFFVEKIEQRQGKTYFTAKSKDFSWEFLAPLPGNHNIENALGALVAAYLLGVEKKYIEMAFNNFLGINRRFEIQYQDEKHVIISDYAHHPEEIKAAVSAAKSLYPNEKITAIFQPHLYSRTRDFLTEFAEELSKLDCVFLAPLYPARELPIEGINSETLLKKINLSEKHLIDEKTLSTFLTEKNPKILLVLGAGDFVKYIPKMIETLNVL